jgi:adenylate cyclase
VTRHQFGRRSEQLTPDQLQFALEDPEQTDAENAVFMTNNLCIAPIIHKHRYELIAADGTRWEIDEFVEPEPGLVIAEVEPNRSSDSFVAPDWLGAEVTHDQRYSNNNIGISPLEMDAPKPA